MASIGNLVVNITANAVPLVKGLKAATVAVGAFAATTKTMATAAVTTFGAAAVRAFTSMGDEMTKMSDRTGVSVEALGKLKHAAEQSDASFESLGNALKFQGKFLLSLKHGSKEAQRTLAELGLSSAMLQGMSPERQFKTFAQAISQISDPGERAALAMQIFGKGAAELLPLLKTGADGISALEAEAESLGIITTEQAQAATALGDAFANLWRTVKMVMFNIGAMLAPYIVPLINGIISGIMDLRVVWNATTDFLSKRWQDLLGEWYERNVAFFEWLPKAVKVAASNVGIAFQNIATAYNNMLTDMLNKSTRKFVEMAYQAGVIDKKTRDAAMGMQSLAESKQQKGAMKGFQALPELNLPTAVASEMGDAIGKALEDDRAKRKAIAAAQPGIVPELDADGNSIAGAATGRKGGKEGLGAVKRGSEEAFRLLSDILYGDKNDTKEQTKLLLKPLNKIAEKLVPNQIALPVIDLFPGGAK